MGNPNVHITNCQGRTANLTSSYTLAQALASLGTVTHATAIQVLEAANFSSVTDKSVAAASGALAGISLAAGLFIEGHFTALALTSGTVRVYLA